MTFQPSPYQMAILNWVVVGTGSAVVIAVAGAGKTKTIELSLPLIPEHMSVQLFAFNTPIAKELNARIEKLRIETGREFRNVRASTFHSLGFGAVCKKLGKAPREMMVDGSKLRKVCDGWLNAREADLYGEFICKLVSYAKGQGIGAISPDVEDAWWALVQHHDLFLEDADADEAEAVSLARQLLQRSNEVARTGFIDFDDQLYLPLLWRLRLWQNDWVLVDEAQDTNPVRRALAKLALKPGGRFMAVGDPKQAIYGFTGASHDAIDIIKREFNAIELPLTVSYRCCKSVIRLAQGLVPYLEGSDTAIEGEVSTLDVKDALNVLDAHDAILCRQTAPLISLAFSIVASGRGCKVLGREIGAGLTNLVKKMKARDIDALEARLEQYLEREVAKFMAKGEENKAEQVSDKVACIMTVIENLDEDNRTVPALLAKIDGLFSDTNGVLMLSTIHKAKGKEWKHVGILRPDLMPSKWARQEWQADQEKNLQYVAYTRAMEQLIFIAGDKVQKAKQPAEGAGQ